SPAAWTSPGHVLPSWVRRFLQARRTLGRRLRSRRRSHHGPARRGAVLHGRGSGGGPHALACAALLPDRVFSAVSVAGVTPYGAPGTDFLAGMGRETVGEVGAALDGPESLVQWMDEHA